MIKEVIWLSGAAEDFQALDTPASEKDSVFRALDSSISLIRQFPEMGPPVGRRRRLRRILIGKRHRLGLFYSVTGSRIIITAILDLRIDPGKIAELLRTRGGYSS